MLVSGFILSSTIPVFQLPNPGGPHKIGTHTFHWVDSLRYEHFTHEDTTDFREIIVQTWFPSKDVQELDPEPYLDFIEILIREKFLFGKKDETIYIIRNNGNKN